MIRRLSLFLLGCLLLGATAASAGGADDVLWESGKEGRADMRRATFVVGDGACAYSVLDDVNNMVTLFPHLERAVVHARRGGWEDVTFYERFFLVGLSESRYFRERTGDQRIEWTLQEGRQKRHDGSWTVLPMPDGRAKVVFENVIEAKSRFSQGILRRIQTRTMEDITLAVLEKCG